MFQAMGCGDPFFNVLKCEKHMAFKHEIATFHQILSSNQHTNLWVVFFYIVTLLTYRYLKGEVKDNRFAK